LGTKNQATNVYATLEALRRLKPSKKCNERKKGTKDETVRLAKIN